MKLYVVVGCNGIDPVPFYRIQDAWDFLKSNKQLGYNRIDEKVFIPGSVF